MVPSSIGPYRIIEALGSGANGEVYLAEDTRLGRKVAVKTLSALDSRELDDARRWVLREARAAARLNHPNIASVYDVLETSDGAHIVMEYVRGDTLRARLHDGPLPLGEVMDIAIQLADALAEAHALGVVHRDLKPANVALTAKGKVKILDFGLAQVRAGEPGSSPVRSSSKDFALEGRQIGTPPYMPPEHLLGDAVDARGDIYSVGVMLFELLTGRRPFQGKDAMTLTMAILTQPTPRASGSNAGVPPAVDEIVFRAMSRLPQSRYASASELADDLRRASKSLFVGPRDPADAPTASRSIRWASHPRPGLALAGLAVVLVAAAFVLSRERPPTTVVTHSDKPRLAILPYVNLTTGRETTDWPDLIQAFLVRELTGIEGLGVVDPLTLDGILENRFGRSRSRGSELLPTLHAAALTLVVDGTISGKPGAYRLQTRLIQPESGEVRFADVSGVRDEGELLPVFTAVARRIVTFLELKAARQDKDFKPYLAGPARNLEAQKAFLQATQYSLRGEPGSETYLRRAVDLDPQFIAARIWLVSSLKMSGQFQAAREEYAILAEQEPHANPFEQSLIRWAAALLTGDLVAQARHVEVSLRYSPDNNILLMTLAEARAALDDHEGALRAIGPPLRVRWRYPDLYVLEGISLLALDRMPEAEAALEKATELQPVAPEVFGMLSALARRREGDQKATAYEGLFFARSREVGRTEGTTQEDLAAHLIRVGLFAKGAHALTQAMPRLPDTSSYWTSLLYRSRRTDAAIEHYAEAVADAAAVADLNLLRGRILEQQGRKQEALTRYREFLASSQPQAVAAAVARRISALQRGDTTPKSQQER